MNGRIDYLTPYIEELSSAVLSTFNRAMTQAIKDGRIDFCVAVNEWTRYAKPVERVLDALERAIDER